MSGENILLVKDEENLAEALRVNLTGEGYRVFVAADGESGLRMAQELRPDLVLLDVTDTDPGIAAHHHPHLFERFYKADQARQDGGFGLGLAIVKQIVTAHGGEANVQSQVGVGSTFIAFLQRAL